MDWHDDGCSIAKHCLSCPLPVCRYDVEGGVRFLLNKERDPAICGSYQAGMPAPAIAAVFGISARSVWRILEQSGVATRRKRVTP